MAVKLSHEEFHNELFDMLCLFSDYCRSHKLRFFLIGGTLLGAVRHKGFIPWDDDIDIGMPRPDYEKFLELVKKDPVADHLRVISSEAGDFDLPFAELLNTQITLKRTEMKYLSDKERVTNLFIDIIPQDGFPDSKLASRWLMFRMDLLRDLTTAAKARLFQGSTPARAVLKTPKVLFAKAVGRRNIVRIMERIALRHPFENSRYIGVVTNGLYGVGERYPRAAAFPSVNVEFCGRNFPAPACYDRYLTGIYGDYMTLPPEEAQVRRHILDAWKEDPVRKLSGKEIRHILMHMLRQFDKLCTDNNLRYSLAGGSLLGAVRHKGFIPWDDDIDVGMPRPDYERFCKMMQGKTLDGGHIRVVSEHNKDWPLPIAKMLDDRVRVDFEYKKSDKYDALWIDILPVDGMPEDFKILKLHFIILDFCRKMLYASLADPNKGTTTARRIAKKLLQPAFKIFTPRFWKKAIIAESRRYDFDKCSHVGISASGLYGPGESVTKDPRCVRMPFEDAMIRCTVKWDEYMTGIYGDYMKLPPKDKRIPHAMEAYLKSGFDINNF